MAEQDIIEEKTTPPPPSDDDDGPPPPGIDPEAWMLSFGDLVSLMLVFFVMLFAMSTLEEEDYEAVVSALAQQFNPSANLDRAKPSVDLDIPKIAIKTAYSLDYLRALLDDKLAGDPLLDSIHLAELDDRLLISISSDHLFDPGRAVLKDAAKDAIGRVGTVVRFVGNRIDVNGHTDPEPVDSPLFPSNWELSLARAMAVADYLRTAGYLDSVRAYGLAASRFSEISLDLPVEERYALARRVDIVVRRGGRDTDAQ